VAVAQVARAEAIVQAVVVVQVQFYKQQFI
jgi:hypothetical protein